MSKVEWLEHIDASNNTYILDPQDEVGKFSFQFSLENGEVTLIARELRELIKKVYEQGYQRACNEEWDKGYTSGYKDGLVWGDKT